MSEFVPVWPPPVALVEEWTATTAAAGGSSPALVALATSAAVTWVQDHRPDLIDPETGAFRATESVVQGTVLLATRLLGRVATGATPTLGLVALAVADDPDTAAMLGLDRPALG